MKKITVFVITYNQEDVIRRAMDSILSQKEWGLYQIIIGDDCSTDCTFDILLEYQSKYPDIVRPIRNEMNLGIYGNLHNVIENRQESDLYIACSGDDAFCEGYLKGIQEIIVKENIPLDEEIGIYSEWKAISPEGKETIGLQNCRLVIKGYNLFSLHMRGLIGNRGLVLSKSVIDKYEPAILDRGLHCAEGIYDSQASRIIKKSYYLPQITTIYYTGVGISRSLSKTDYNTTGNIAKWEYFINNLIKKDRKKDICYAKYQISRSRFLVNPNWKNFFRCVYYFIRGIYPVSLKNLKTLIKIIVGLPCIIFKEKK